MTFSRFLMLSVFACSLSACGAYPKAAASGDLPAPPPPDYAVSGNWAALPTKEDNADRTPGSLLRDGQATAGADVFFLHPTHYRKTNDRSEGWNANLLDGELNKTVDDGSILNQASIFNAAGRIYAPRYRQANIQVYYKDGRPYAERALEIAYQDVLAAFDYYLANYNDGRPIVIASHSQGTTHAKRLLADRFDGKPLRDQLVVAYLIGMPVSKDAYRNIPVCEDATQTGCFVSWRTYRDDFEPAPGYRDSVANIAVVNPLTWTTEPGVAAASLNKGGVLFNYDKGPLEKLVSAEIRGGGLFTSKPSFFGDVLFTTKNYHIADYNFFWVNVRENAVDRVAAFDR
ncbi:DUF3089 domain-containing protein [Neolewinella antarctica]|uniref:DUF3089 domain-containing protein n=1 Tax=Neolewinella antarctica TaxID=442734 RepID=A0ABX0XES0_9BACT|nr:DUF3089 domain-containing protein [Neolewinella antarctica]NJC27820.1 hypothetical protein [Neolewinella antarctica]